jgi:hexulose-6-phosphate isomerase
MELEKGIASIVAVHIKEVRSVTDDFPGQFKCVPFGTGNVDFVKCFAKLEQLNYRGPYLIEMWSNPKENDEDSVGEALGFIQQKYDWAMK